MRGVGGSGGIDDVSGRFIILKSAVGVDEVLQLIDLLLT